MQPAQKPLTAPDIFLEKLSFSFPGTVLFRDLDTSPGDGVDDLPLYCSHIATGECAGGTVVDDIEDLWDAFAAACLGGEVFTLPHHHPAGGPARVDWSDYTSSAARMTKRRQYEPLVDVYSQHGSSEVALSAIRCMQRWVTLAPWKPETWAVATPKSSSASAMPSGVVSGRIPSIAASCVSPSRIRRWARPSSSVMA